MGFWFQLLAFAVTFTIGQLLAAKNRPKGPKPSDSDPLDEPTGHPIPVVWGRCKVAPAITWWGDTKSVARTQSAKVLSFTVSRQTIGYRYFLGFQAVICWGPVDELYEVWLEGDKRLSLIGLQNEHTGFSPNAPFQPEYTIRTPIIPVLPLANPPGGSGNVIDIFAPNVLGGELAEGGIDGVFDFHWGDDPQFSNGYLLAEMDPGGVSTFPGLCYAVFRQIEIGHTPRLKQLHFEVGRYPALLGDPTKAKIANPDAVGTFDANPAEMLYELLLDTRWARLGITAADIDLASFQAARDTLFAEGLGMSMILREQESGEQIADEILRHIDGVLYEAPLTGLLTLKLARDDYDPATIPTVDASIYPKPPKLARQFYSEMITDVKVIYSSRAKAYKEDVAIAQNLALQNLINEVRQEPFEFRGLTSGTVANRVAWRVLQTVSRPLWRGTVPVTRALAHLGLGDVFKLTVDEYGFFERIFRITGARYGDAEGARPEFDVVEDIFADPVSVHAVPANQWNYPTEPHFIPPVAEVHLDRTATDGTLGLIVYDPEARVTATEVNVQVGNGAPSGWTPIDPATFEITSLLDPALPTTIGYRITYLLPDGTPNTVENYEVFPATGGIASTITAVIRDGSLQLTPGHKLDLSWDFNCDIESVEMLADQTGSLVIDIWKDTYGNYPPTVADSICAAAKPTISGAVKSQDIVLTGWTKAYTAGQTLRFHVDSATNITRCLVKLKVRRK